MSPNQPRTPSRNVRVSDDLWDAAKVRASERGENLSEKIREFLTEYAKEES